MAKLKTVDIIGNLDAEIKKLVAKRAKLAAGIRDYRGIGVYEGEVYQAVVYESGTTTLNLPKLKRKLGADYHKFLKKGTKTSIRIELKSKSKKRRA